MNETQKTEYTTPQLEITIVKMEEGIATGSAKVIPTNINGAVYEEWEQNPEDTHQVDW